jgi:hypothetical protein
MVNGRRYGTSQTTCTYVATVIAALATLHDPKRAQETTCAGATIEPRLPYSADKHAYPGDPTGAGIARAG